MKNLSLLIFASLFLFNSFAQVDDQSKRPTEPLCFEIVSHSLNFKSLPEISFYKSKNNWQYIIDTTWGPGLPLAEKQQIFNAYATSIREQFDGFESLQMNLNSWDSLRVHYDSMIDDSTSKGGFSAIMTRFSMEFHDLHTYAYDDSVVFSPLNPGIPVLILGSYSLTVEHFGAVITALPDSSLLILRTLSGHPLNLEPGDILLGYEGIPWKILVNELLDAGLPIVGRWGGAPSAYTDEILLGAGLNWHLFDTIDILKHSTGDTVHLSVNPLLNLPPINMLNNEQLPIPGISFPDYHSGQYVSYGIIEGTNIGYIYLTHEVEGISDQQFYEAITALFETDALIIDMRLNFGGWAFFNSSLQLLFNDSHLTIEDAYRCNINDFTLCPSGNSNVFRVPGIPNTLYDRPIAVLLGPTCVSMGDITAQRLKYHPMVRFFGKSSAASLGDNVFIANYPDWTIRYSISDMFHVSEPGAYLNRTEFPINYPVWFNPDDVANGYDTVVEEALEWINNLVYGHNVTTNRNYLVPGSDSVIISATIENPNSHSVSSKIYIRDLENTLIDSLELIETEIGSIWEGSWVAVNYEEFFKLEIKASDQTTGDTFKIDNVARVTTIGPIVITDYYFTSQDTTPGAGDLIICKIKLKNQSATFTVPDVKATVVCEDTLVTITSSLFTIGDLSPGEEKEGSGLLMFNLDENCPHNYTISFDVKIMSEGWGFWQDDFDIITGIDDAEQIPIKYSLYQNYPNPFNPSTKIKYSIPQDSKVMIKVFDILGNKIETLVNEEKKAGTYEITWNAVRLPSGVYFYQIKSGDFIDAKKMVLMK
jgi:hypothetical protein